MINENINSSVEYSNGFKSFIETARSVDSLTISSFSFLMFMVVSFVVWKLYKSKMQECANDKTKIYEKLDDMENDIKFIKEYLREIKK